MGWGCCCGNRSSFIDGPRGPLVYTSRRDLLVLLCLRVVVREEGVVAEDRGPARCLSLSSLTAEVSVLLVLQVLCHTLVGSRQNGSWLWTRGLCVCVGGVAV